MKLSLTKPVRYEAIDRWIVYIIGEDGLLTGIAGEVAGEGNSPEEAIEKAQIIIDKMKTDNK